MLSRTIVRLAAFLPLVLLATPMAAQDAMAGPAAAHGPAAGPTFDNLQSGYQIAEATSTDLTWDAKRRSSRDNGKVLAIVGGVAFIGGLIIDGDAGTAIAVGGLVIGLIGLYQWLK